MRFRVKCLVIVLPLIWIALPLQTPADVAPVPMARGGAFQQQEGKNNHIQPSPASGSVEGTVIDKSTNLPLAYCNIVFVLSGMGAMTKKDGSFSIHNMPPGHYAVLAGMMGYAVDTLCHVEVECGKTIHLSFELDSDPHRGSDAIIGEKWICEIHGFQLVIVNVHLVSNPIVHDEAYEKARRMLFPHGELEIYDECLSQSLDSKPARRGPACIKARERWLSSGNTEQD